jgi:hypothetical protein
VGETQSGDATCIRTCSSVRDGPEFYDLRTTLPEVLSQGEARKVRGAIDSLGAPSRAAARVTILDRADDSPLRARLASSLDARCCALLRREEIDGLRERPSGVATRLTAPGYLVR